jgi:hypothetical protein
MGCGRSRRRPARTPAESDAVAFGACSMGERSSGPTQGTRAPPPGVQGRRHVRAPAGRSSVGGDTSPTADYVLGSLGSEA